MRRQFVLIGEFQHHLKVLHSSSQPTHSLLHALGTTKIVAKRSVGKSQSNGIAITAWKRASIHQAAHKKERQHINVRRRERHPHKRRQPLNMFGIVLAKHFLVNQYVEAIIVTLFPWG